MKATKSFRNGSVSALLLAVLVSACSVPEAEPPAVARAADAVAASGAVDRAAVGGWGEQGDYTPFKKADGSRFRVAVAQSGDYFSYADVLEGTLKGLATIGWIEQVEPLLPGFTGYAAYADGKTAANILKELEKYDYSEFIEFAPEAFFDLKWDDTKARGAAFDRLRSADSGIDLVVSLGTQVSTALTGTANFAVPILVDSVSDPVGSGILVSLEDSGHDCLTGGVDPDQDLRQVRLFHSVIGFKRLGILYEDSEIGRAYGAIDAVRQVAGELGFEVVAGTDVLPDPEDEDDEAAWAAAEARYISALEQLCPQVDAVYLAVQAGLSEYSLPDIVAVLNKHRIPSFIMEGKDFVRNGILLGESDSNILAKGIFNAKKIARILGGTKARDLPLIYEPVPHIAINLDTAQTIGYDVPIDIIASADEVFAGRGLSE